MKLFKLITLGVFMCGAVLFTACTSTVNTVERADSRANPNVIDDKRVITDTGLANKISVVQVSEGTVSGDLLKIQITLQNNSSRAQNVSYSFEWIDENGMMVNSPTDGWRSLRLMGKETKSISRVAPSPKVVDFTLKLQEAR